MKIKDNETKIKLAEQQGSAFQEAVDYLKEIVAGYQEQVVDDYIVTVCAEEAEGMYHLEDGELTWEDPAEGLNAHLEIIIQDADDKRFIPQLDVVATLYSEDQEMEQEKQHPFLWHPYVFHYGANWKIPKEGNYSVEVKISAPRFHRHDVVKGKKYPRQVTLHFGNLKMETDRKLHAPE